MNHRKLANLIILLAIALSGCAPTAAIPNPTNSPVPAAATPIPANPPAPTATALPSPTPTTVPPTVTPLLQPTATAVIPTIAPLKGFDPATTDATLARLRVNQCVGGMPDMDFYLNGTVPMTAGRSNSLAAGDVGRYVYLKPGTVQVAVGSSDGGIDKAFFTPLDVTVEAGHRYTVVILGQSEEASHKALVIDETKAYENAGETPGSARHITVNNIKGAPTLSFVMDGKGEKNVPYGGFAASVLPSGNFKTFTVSVGDKVLEDNGSGWNWYGSDTLDCFYGSYSSTGFTETANTSILMSGLKVIDYLQGLSDEHASGVDSPSFATFLAALKSAGLTDLLSTSGPYLLFAPTDAAFAELPKGQLDALKADPKALANFLRAYIVEGFYPLGTLSTGGTYDSTLTNLLGKPLVLTGPDENIGINGVKVGLIDNTIVANGTRVYFFRHLFEPPAS